MTTAMKLLASLAFVGLLAGCAGMGFMAPDDPPIYETSLSD